MEKVLNLTIERLPEGYYLATSENIPGFIAQGRTVIETLEIARDVARKLLEVENERQESTHLPPVAERFDYPLIIGA